MRLLDLFCGAGGCSVGYHRAGLEVVGVDIKTPKEQAQNRVSRNQWSGV